MHRNPHAPPAEVLDLLLDAVCFVDADGRFIAISAACERIFGYTPDEMVGRTTLELVHPDDRAATQAAASRVAAGDVVQGFENRYLRKDGRVVHLQWTARWSERHGMRVAVARDVGERARALALREALYAISEAAHTAPDPPALRAALERAFAHWLPELRIHWGPGAASTAATVESLEPGADRSLLAFLGQQLADALERHRLRARLEHLALYDALTGLPNRELLRDRLRGALARAQREGGRVALLYLDLDDFKGVNDRFGHAVGDAVLRAVAARLQGVVRGSDTVARLAGDEFVVVLERIDEGEGVPRVAAALLAAFEAPLEAEGRALHVRPSIGMAAWPGDGADADALMRRADAAMYAAKRAGGGRIAAAANAPARDVT